jgi:hypothetical protein
MNLSLEEADAGPSSAGPHQIVIVHGTWARGVFPRISESISARLAAVSKRQLKPRWFENDSTFSSNLVVALKEKSIDAVIESLFWSGSNSVFERDAAARNLAVLLSAKMSKPSAPPVTVIAHSHGGNVALRAIQLLGDKAINIRLITLATPFVRVFPVTVVQRMVWYWLGLALLFSLAALLSVIVGPSFGRLFISSPTPDDIVKQIGNWAITDSDIVGLRFLMLVVGCFVAAQLWIKIVLNLYPKKAYRHAERTDSYYTLTRGEGWGEWPYRIADAAYYDTRQFPDLKFLVLRGVDDEAALTLAAGAIGSRLNYLTMTWLGPIALVLALLAAGWKGSIPGWNDGEFFSATNMVSFGVVISAMLSGVFKSAYGREFLIGAIRCDLASDSVPDLGHGGEAITLPPLNSTTQHELRHAIYDHPECIPAIAAWLTK